MNEILEYLISTDFGLFKIGQNLFNKCSFEEQKELYKQFKETNFDGNPSYILTSVFFDDFADNNYINSKWAA